MKKLGFTLAEVLITLVIIGVIAAMTVPTLMNNTNAQEFRSAFKKAISGVNQALTLHYALEGSSAADYSQAGALVNEVFKTRMSTIDIDTGTFAANDFSSIGGETGAGSCSAIAAAFNAGDTATKAAFSTADGMIFCVTNYKAEPTLESATAICNADNTTPCVATANQANLFIDVNGVKKPNRATTNVARPRDQYSALIYSQKVVPFGEAAQGVMFDAK